MQRGRLTVVPLVAVVDAVALVALRPHPVRLSRCLAHAATWLTRQPDAALADLVGAALWLVAVWLGVGLAAGVLAHLPGAAGTLGRRVVRVALPRALRPLVVGSLGVGIVLTPVAASAAATHPGAAPVPSPAWPTSAAMTTPAPEWPVSAPPDRPAPAAPTRPPTTHVPTAHVPTTSVRVRTGDSLWRLAADRLGPDPQPPRVAHYWQRIYAANRAVVGADPDRLTPGQQLVLPAPTAQELP